MAVIKRNSDPLRRSNIRRNSLRIGFYGCKIGNKVVRLKYREHQARDVEKLRLNCPACGHEHVVEPFWRDYVPRIDDGKETLILEDSESE